MSTRGVCSAPINEGSDIKCTGGCNRFFHCACVKTESDGVTARLSSEDLQQQIILIHEHSPHAGAPLRVLEEFKKDIFNELKSVRSEMGEMTTSMQFWSDKVVASNKLMDEIRKELALIKKENKGLRQQNVTLKKEVVDLQERIRNLEQYSRKNNIEISGILTTPNEHVNDIVKDLGSSFGVEILPAQILAAYRIPSFSKARAPAVVVKFHDRAVKEDLLAKFREARRRSAHLTADKINKAFPSNKVYVNNRFIWLRRTGSFLPSSNRSVRRWVTCLCGAEKESVSSRKMLTLKFIK
ncbi:hypothetical protein J6590_074181 [Homalodisca vitripennis]|nr:hypothetical protein J6590_074181 [Homalodisca vitripennis]